MDGKKKSLSKGVLGGKVKRPCKWVIPNGGERVSKVGSIRVRMLSRKSEYWYLVLHEGLETQTTNT